jgi:hypothetical protein
MKKTGYPFNGDSVEVLTREYQERDETVRWAKTLIEKLEAKGNGSEKPEKPTPARKPRAIHQTAQHRAAP